MNAPRFAIDIGSTVIKLAKLDDGSGVPSQQFFERDFETGIYRQVEEILAATDGYDGEELLICSSANGGLRVGILCLSRQFSGAALRNQVLLAGANPIYLHEFDEEASSSAPVDILLIGGGIDCDDGQPLLDRIEKLDLDRFSYRSLMYAGNRHAAPLLKKRFPDVHIVPNPLSDTLTAPHASVFEAVRDAYLADIVHKDGVSELGKLCKAGVRPTPEVVNRGFQRGLSNRSTFDLAGASVVVDIGGATTDLHYTVEIVREDSEEMPQPGASMARYVFTDLGVVASRDTTLAQMRIHPRLYEFLSVVVETDVRNVYRSLREGEYEPAPMLLSYGCLFLALERFSRGAGPGLPSGNLNKISNVILTGGAAQMLEMDRARRLLGLISNDQFATPLLRTDTAYRLWVDGITWEHE